MKYNKTGVTLYYIDENKDKEKYIFSIRNAKTHS